MLRVEQTTLAIAAAVTLYAIWVVMLWGFPNPVTLTTSILQDVVFHIALPLVLLILIYKFGGVGPSRYWLVSPFSSQRGSEVVGPMVISVLLLLTYVLVANMVGGIATTKSVDVTQGSTALHPFSVAMLIIYSAASASFSEEVFFRGIPRLISMRVSNVWVRNLGFLVVSSTLFGLMHLPYGIGSAIASGYFGVLAGSILIWTNNLWYPLVGHFVTDLLVMWWTYARMGTLPI